MRKPKKPRLRGATNNIAKTYIYQIIILMVPMTAVFGIFLYLVFINAPLYVLAIVGFVGPLTWFMSIISIYYSAKGALADKENFAPIIFTDVDGNSIPYWTYATPNVKELGIEQVKGMTVAGTFHEDILSTWHKNEVLWPETIMLPDGRFFRKSWIYTPAVWDSCVKPDEIILGDNRPISELSIGTHAIGMSGHNVVKEVMVRPFDGQMISVKASGLLPVQTTPEHPLFVSTSITRWVNGHKNIVGFTKPEWVPSCSIIPKQVYEDGHYLVVPRISGTIDSLDVDCLQYAKDERSMKICKTKGIPTRFPLNMETSWLLGVYVAEGYTNNHGSIGLSLGYHENALRDRIMSIFRALGYSPFITHKETTQEVRIKSHVLARALHEWCGRRATNKKIPDFLIFHKDIHLLEEFLKGYMAGDGYIVRNRTAQGEHISAGTVSKTLALQLQLAYARLGVLASVSPMSRTHNIEGREVHTHQAYSVNVLPYSSDSKYRVFDEYILTPVRDVNKTEYQGSVHNIETTDNTYLVSNAVVHNCFHRQRVFTASRGLPVSARGIPLATLLIVDVDVDYEPTHVGEPVPTCIMTNCWYNEKMRLKRLGKHVPTEESIGRIKESVALRRMQTLMLEKGASDRFADSMADEVIKEREHAPKIVGQALKAIETLDEEPSTIWDKKWIIIGIVIIAVSVVTVVSLWGAGILRF